MKIVSRIVQLLHFYGERNLDVASSRLLKWRCLALPHSSRVYVYRHRAQTYLGVLLRPVEDVDDERVNDFILAQYAAQHLVGRSEFEHIASHIQHWMEELFYLDSPYFTV